MNSNAIENTDLIRILGIAPYTALKNSLEHAVAGKDNIQLDVYLGDMEEALEVIHRIDLSKYDVIISRGGTADLIRKNTTIPVVEISLSIYDILCSMKLAENYTDKYAIAAFPSIADTARILNEILQFDMDIYTLHSVDEVRPLLLSLKEKGYQMILGDKITNAAAKDMEINTLLIVSGSKSVQDALDLAIRLAYTIKNDHLEKRLLTDVLSQSPQKTIILDSSGSPSAYSTDCDPFVLALVQKEYRNVLSGSLEHFSKIINNCVYSFTCRRIVPGQKAYAVFYYTVASSSRYTQEQSIQYLTAQDVQDRFFNSFFSITLNSGELQHSLDQINRTRTPIILFGEEGAGKEQTAHFLYLHSNLCKSDFVTIFCGMISGKSWDFLMNHADSPLYGNDRTIYFHQLDKLTDEKINQLISVLTDTKICSRNRVIFSYTLSGQEKIPISVRKLITLTSGVSLSLPALRDHKQKIASLAILFLNSYNVSDHPEDASMIIGFEPDAIEMLREYDWPYNYAQLKRILNELVINTRTPYILASQVDSLLRKERALFGGNESPDVSALPIGQYSEVSGSDLSKHLQKEHKCVIDLNATLDASIRTIILQTLEENDGNQSLTAKKLGISRTTLWRYLKE